MKRVNPVMIEEKAARSFALAVVAAFAAGAAMVPQSVEAVNNAAGHYVASDYAGAGTWNNRHALFNDATPIGIGGNFNTTPSTGALINGHGSIFFNANNDGNLNSGGAFAVAGSAAVTAAGTNPTSGARAITMSAVFQTRDLVGGRGGAHWQNSGLIGNEQPGGGRGDWGLTYEGSNGQGFQSDVEVAQAGGTFNNNLPHILTYSIANPAASNTATVWVDGQLVNTGNANFLQADINRTLDTGASSNFSIGVSTGANLGSNGDNGFIHGDLAEIRIDSFLAPSTGPSFDLNAAQIVTLHNHLSGKYATVLTANNFYAGDAPSNGNHDNGIIGIVGISGTKLSSTDDRWLTSLASSGLTLTELGGSIADNEGVFAGHNSFISTTVPNTTIVGGRTARTWYVDVTGDVDFSMTFDLSDLGVAFATTPILFFSLDGIAFNPLAITPTIAGDQFTFDMSSFTGGDGFFALGAVTVPEPASASLLLLGTAALLRRRRVA